MKIIPLSEGSFTIDGSKKFVPFEDSTDDLQSRPVGSLLVEVQPFLVITSRDVLLLDTGLGFKDRATGEMQLHKNLKDAGVDPASITKVLMSHLHKDHAGGVADATDNRKLSFPQATYYVREDELKFAFEKGTPSYLPEELELLRQSSQVVLLDQEEGTIDGYIHYQLTGAHSPYHQVLRIEDEAEVIFFGADDAPQLQQMKHRFVAKYDYDGKKAMELRRKWWEEGAAAGWTFLFYHDVRTPIYAG